MNSREVKREQPFRLLQVISSLDPASGGPPVAAAELNKGLREIGIMSEIHSPQYPLESDILTIGDASRIYPRSRPYVLENSWPMWRGLWRASNNAHFIHIHGSYRVSTALGYYIARVRRIPFGFQPHGVLEPYQRQTSRIGKAVFDAVAGRHMLRNATYVMVASESELRNASDKIPPGIGFVNSLGAYLEVDPESKPLGNDPRRFVLFLGRFAKKKRPDMLIEAWAIVQHRLQVQGDPADHVLVLVGPDDYWSREDLLEMVKTSGVADSVIVQGPAGPSEKSSLMHAASIFVLPSENENFAISIVEALLGGCFVVTTEQVAASAHVKSSGTGCILESANLDALAAALYDAVTHPDAVDRSGDLATAYATRHLSWSSTARRLARRAAWPAGNVDSHGDGHHD